jgi:hypothetical protein
MTVRWSIKLLVIVAAGMALSSCTLQSGPATYGYQSDPALLSHSQWCATNPASGYCMTRDRR